LKNTSADLTITFSQVTKETFYVFEYTWDYSLNSDSNNSRLIIKDDYLVNDCITLSKENNITLIDYNRKNLFSDKRKKHKEH